VTSPRCCGNEPYEGNRYAGAHGDLAHRFDGFGLRASSRLVARCRRFILVNRTRGETFETRTLVHSSGALVTVMTHDGTAEMGTFDERRVGLDHLAFRVANRDELQQWMTHLDAKGVTHSDIIDIGFGPTVVFRGPDNLQLEFFVHPGADELKLNAADSEEAQRVLAEVLSATNQE
jgi:glyoxylase I family protein